MVQEKALLEDPLLDFDVLERGCSDTGISYSQNVALPVQHRFVFISGVGPVHSGRGRLMHEMIFVLRRRVSQTCSPPTSASARATAVAAANYCTYVCAGPTRTQQQQYVVRRMLQVFTHTLCVCVAYHACSCCTILHLRAPH